MPAMSSGNHTATMAPPRTRAANRGPLTSLTHRIDDGLEKLVNHQKGRVDSWVDNQIAKLGEKVLDWAEGKIYNLLNQSFDRIEENMSLRNN